MSTPIAADRHASRVGLAPDYRRCTHLYSNGRRCADPSLNNRELCFTHHNRRVRVSMKPMPPVNYDRVPLVSFVYAEDLRDIHENWNAALDAWARHSIDIRQLSVLDRYFETGRRILRQMESSEKKLERHEATLDARWDEKGNPTAIDPAQPKPPAAEPASDPEVQPGTLSNLNAEAEDEAEPIPQPKPDQLVKGRRALSRLYASLVGRQKVKRLNSYTYVLEGNKMASIPPGQRRCRFQQATHRCRIYIQIPKMI